MLQWCFSGASVVFQWCFSGASVMLQWYFSDASVMLQWCFSDASAKVFQSNGNNLPTLLQWNELLGRRVIHEMLVVLPFFAISLLLVVYESLRSVGERWKENSQTTTKQPNNQTTTPGTKHTKHAYWVSIFVFVQCQMMWVPVQFLLQYRPPTTSHQSSHSIFDTPKY